MRKLFVFYHSHCIDGITAAGAFEHLPTDQYEMVYVPINYSPSYNNDVLSQPYKNGDTIIFVDFAPSLDLLDKLRTLIDGNDDTEIDNELDVSIHILDHHKTAINNFADINCYGNEFFYFNNDNSGAKIAFAYVATLLDGKDINVANIEQALIDTTDLAHVNKYGCITTAERLHRWSVIKEHVSDRDIWQFKLADTNTYYHYLRYLADSVNWDVPTYVSNIHDNSIVDILNIGGILADKFERDCQLSAKRAAFLPTREDPHYAILSISPDQASRVGEILYKEMGIPVVVMYYDDFNLGIRQYMLRSSSEWDVESIAKRMGGGGHKNAAGVRVSHEDTIMNLAFPIAAIRTKFTDGVIIDLLKKAGR